MKDRIYVCHTFYHAYISVVKELNLKPEERGGASLMLSSMSNDFGDFANRAEESGLFEEVISFDEKEDVTFPEIMKYHRDRGNIVLNLFQRVKYTKALGKAQEAYVPIDFREYKDIYVFNDSDPIGYYLNYKKIYYHAIEDGLDTVVYTDDARYGNRGHFGLKAFMAAHNLIFIENGYSKYCIDFEVNDLSRIKYTMPNFIEVPRKELTKAVKQEDLHYLTDIFLNENWNTLEYFKSAPSDKKKVMILSDPVCDYETRKKIMRDIVDEYGKDATVFIKQHPRDIVDYTEELPDCIIVKEKFPMEIMNIIPEFHVDLAVTILTVPDGIEFADKVIFLGNDFMDKYEDPAIHRTIEMI